MPERCGTCHFAPCRCEDLQCEYKPLSDKRRVAVAGVTGKAGWPRESDAFGVHPSQVQEAYEESVALGVPTQFTKNGSAKIENESHQRRFGKVLKLHERNCFNW